MTDYPLIKDLGLKVHIVDLKDKDITDTKFSYLHNLTATAVVEAEPLNKLLSEAPVVTAVKSSGTSNTWTESKLARDVATHEARLIGVKARSQAVKKSEIANYVGEKSDADYLHLQDVLKKNPRAWSGGMNDKLDWSPLPTVEQKTGHLECVIESQQKQIEELKAYIHRHETTSCNVFMKEQVEQLTKERDAWRERALKLSNHLHHLVTHHFNGTSIERILEAEKANRDFQEFKAKQEGL